MLSGRLQAHVIHRRSRLDRLERFLRWNAHHPVDWHWHDAVEACEVDRNDQTVMAAPDLDLRDTAIAAALSHRRQWQACVEDATARLVFEDDACARNGFAPLVAKVMSALTAEGAMTALPSVGAMSALMAVDMIYFGYNLDGAVLLELPDKMFSRVQFGDMAMAGPAYFDAYARTAPMVSPPALYRGYLNWGLLAYAVSPAGAAKLLAQCFPLRPVALEMFELGRVHEGLGLDAQVNAALQRQAVIALSCFPPLVIGPNGDSDIDPSKR